MSTLLSPAEAPAGFCAYRTPSTYRQAAFHAIKNALAPVTRVFFGRSRRNPSSVTDGIAPVSDSGPGMALASSRRGTEDEDRESLGVEAHGIGLAPRRTLPATLERLLTEERQRDDLVIELLFASRELAEKRLGPASPVGRYCLECAKVSLDRGATIAHKEGCATGRVLSVLDRICVRAGTQNLTTKEAAPDHEEGRAGDGIRSRGAISAPAAGSDLQGGAQ
jgi:hypothetical protein